MGYPSDLQLERRHICREIFTLEKWTSMTAYGADQGAPVGPEHPDQPKELVETPARHAIKWRCCWGTVPFDSFPIGVS